MAGMLLGNLFSRSVEPLLPGIAVRLGEGVAVVLRSVGIFVDAPLAGTFALSGMLGFACGVAIWLMESEQ